MYHDRQWTLEKARRRLALITPAVYHQRAELDPLAYQILPDASVTPDPAATLTGEIETLAYNSYWGGDDITFLMQTRFTIPSEWADDAPVALYLPLGDAHSFSHPEALVYVDGDSIAACDRHHQEILLSPRYRDGAEHLLTLHGWTGSGPQERRILFMQPCQIVQIDPATRQFVARARVALETVDTLDENSYERARLLNALEAAFKQLDTREPLGEGFYDSVPAAYRTLSEGIAQAGEALPAKLVAAGHAHIDVAWLWTLDQVRRKVGRTFSTVLHYMDEFERYTFTQSQPQLYDYARQDYPALFEQIKQRVQEGRWEVIGGMWVEADCNVPSGESLARQFLLGRRFFEAHFGAGVETPVLWLPDVFGYSAAMPQLIKQAGLEYFFTTKISWNQYNKMPYDSFWWQGIDGTQVLSHFTTTPGTWNLLGSFRTYNATATPSEIVSSWTNLQHKEHQDTMLMSYGYGDGGGGPTREMLENIREMEQFPGVPQVRHDTVWNFFRDLEAEAGATLPTWNGELYFELHRGTYTTQARLKQANRRSEFALHNAEFLASLAGQVQPNADYPTDALRKAWELVCLNQFHDILPGTSIQAVYPEALAHHAEAQDTAERVSAAALAQVGVELAGDVLLVNPNSFVQRGLLLWPDAPDDVTGIEITDGQTHVGQRVEAGLLLADVALSPYTVAAVTATISAATPMDTGLSVSQAHLENDLLRVEFNAAGDITRIYDKHEAREVLPEGVVANQFQAFEDRPLEWDAWDIDIFYTDRMWTAEPATSIEVVAEGPLRATLRIERSIQNSPYIQHISLDYDSAMIRFETQIDWQARKMVLKVAFPVDILANTATYEIQWGNLQRPTHWNTSWDWARFETCAQKWVDLSEGGYGVSLLNDCKYGHDIKDNIMRLTLLRAPDHPDPTADQGEHSFSYGLLPHAGDWRNGTIPLSYQLNNPAFAVANPAADGGEASHYSLVQVDAAHVVIETVKAAEDGRGLIVRLYESQQQRGPVTLTAMQPIQAAHRCNLLEDDQETLQPDGQTLTLHIKPFEIQTIRLEF